MRLRATTMLTTPRTTMANGSGHHQCSQNTLKLPWLLSRPVQKTPNKMSRTPTAAPVRLAIELTTTGYLRRAVDALALCPPEACGTGG